LPDIESNSSDDQSATHSLATTPIVSSRDSSRHPGKKRARRSQDGLFDITNASASARASEKQLIDQAMAAYPNEQEHEPVEHFAVEDSDAESSTGKVEADDGTDPKVFRRESAADLDCQMREMRKHHAQLEEARRTLKEDTAGQSRFSAAALSARHKAQARNLEKTQKGPSPPMLGSDLVFPLSASPKTTRCDVDQIPVPRINELDSDEEPMDDEPGLWNLRSGGQDFLEGGLWSGLCQKKGGEDRAPTAQMRSGLMTPAINDLDGLDGISSVNGVRDHSPQMSKQTMALLLTPSSPQRQKFSESVSKQLNTSINLEREIEAEFHSGFITQIYNYLSLGYPSLAHKFDEELSKISQIPLELLREDDDLADAKGYVGAPEGEGLDEASAMAGKCARWTALRLYIHEWARQKPGMTGSTNNGWGVRARRGSWAI
jgi:hypothetical protein